jgi:hypothetical protein
MFKGNQKINGDNKKMEGVYCYVYLSLLLFEILIVAKNHRYIIHLASQHDLDLMHAVVFYFVLQSVAW